MSHNSRPSLEGFLLLFGMTLGWGINWPIMKSILYEVPPMTFRGFCLFWGGIGILLIAKFCKYTLSIPKAYWKKFFVICFFNIFIWNLLASYGLSLLPAGRSALLGYTMPMWAVLLSVWLLKEPFNFRIVLGLLLGTLGIFILMSESVLQWLPHNNQASLSNGGLLIGGLLMIVAAWCWALGTNLMKLWALPIHSIVLTGWLLLTASIPMIVATLVVDGVPQQLPSTASCWGILYNVLIAFMFCYWAWIRIIEIMPVGVSSLSSLLTPLIGVFSSIWLLNETPGWREYTAAALILGAVAVVNWQASTKHRISHIHKFTKTQN